MADIRDDILERMISIVLNCIIDQDKRISDLEMDLEMKEMEVIEKDDN